MRRAGLGSSFLGRRGERLGLAVEEGERLGLWLVASSTGVQGGHRSK